MRMLHVAVIGARGFGRHHLTGYQASPHVESISISGRDADALQHLAQEFPKVRRIVTDPQALLRDPSVDLVDIVLPHHLHLEVAQAAIAEGKHLVMEKPPARTTAEFQVILDLAAARGCRIFPILNLLWEPLHQAVRAAIDRGVIGEPFYSVETVTSTAMATYTDASNWRADRELCGGGLLIDGGFHSVYRQLYFLESLGMPQALTADCGQIGVTEPGKGEDFAAITWRYGSGARVHLAFQWTARASLGRIPSGILGTEGSLVFTGDPATPALVRLPGCDDEPLFIPPGPRGFAETVADQVSHSAECLVTGAEPFAGSDLAMLTLELIHAAYQAGQSGVRMPLKGSFRTRFPAMPPDGDSSP